MRKTSLIVGLVLMVVLVFWEAYDFIVTNEGVRYFTSDPRRLGFVVLIAILGGFLSFAFSRLSSSSRRRLTLIALGGFASAVTAFLGYFAYSITSFSSMITESGAWRWVIAGICSLLAVAVLLWFEFYQVYRRHETPAA